MKLKLQLDVRLTIISALIFSLPILILFYFQLSAINYDIRFATLELYGNAYQKPLEQILRGASEYYLGIQQDKSGPALSGSEKLVDGAFDELSKVDEQIGADLQFTSEGLAIRDRSHLTVPKVRAQWDKLTKEQSEEERKANYIELIAAVREMITHSGDTSNLILDPDLDSYYLMDVTLLALPQTQDRLARIIDSVSDMLASGTITAADRVDLAISRALLQESDFDRVMASSQTALNEDQNFYGLWDSLQNDYPVEMEDYAKKTKRLIATLESIASEEKVSITRDEFVAIGMDALDSSYQIWDAAVGQLDSLLNIRIADFKKTRMVAGLLTALAVAVALGLVYLVGRYITRPLRVLTGALGRIALGDAREMRGVDQAQIPRIAERSDELGQIGQATSALMDYMRQAARAADEIAGGRLDCEIKTASEDDLLGKSFIVMRDKINDVINAAHEMADQQQQGDTDFYITESNFEGAFRTLVEAINHGVRMHIETIMKILSVVSSYADGMFEPKLEQLPGKQAIANEKMDLLRSNLMALIEEAGRLTAAARAGDLNTRAAADRLQGDYQRLLAEFNATLDALVAPMRAAANHVARISGGDIPESSRDEAQGEFLVLRDNLNQCGDAIRLLIADMARLAEAGVAGDLITRIDARLHRGDFGKIVQGVNNTLDAITRPLNEASNVIQSAARQDLTVRMTGEYRGQMQALKNDVNTMTDKLQAALANVEEAVDQVHTGAAQISSASDALSQSATRQASSLEEISSSITEIASQTKQNAENAELARKLAASTRTVADTGAQQMGGMMTAMQDINASSQQIARINKVIDDIAFQTNLLALNAAVEAARAGRHGKGFAVVADEVRNLAGRSAKAARETAELIEESAEKVNNGLTAAEQTGQSLEEIVNSIVRVTDLIEEIAASSKEQAQGVGQIHIGLSQVDEVTQSNTASAEQTAASSQELATLSQQLQDLVHQFKLGVGQDERSLPSLDGKAAYQLGGSSGWDE